MRYETGERERERERDRGFLCNALHRIRTLYADRTVRMLRRPCMLIPNRRIAQKAALLKKLVPKTLPPTIFHVCLWRCMFFFQCATYELNADVSFPVDASMQVSSGTGMAFGRTLPSMVISLASEETFTLSQGELNR